MRQPVTGGVKTPVTPMRGFAQPVLETGANVTIPAFLGFRVTFTSPLAFDRAVVIVSAPPLILMRIPFTALPFWVTFSVSVVLRPTKRVFFGATLTAVQYFTGGTNGPFATTEALAVLLAVFVSCSAATVVAVLVSVPV